MEKPNWFEIKRESPILEVELNGEMMRLDYWNTWVYMFHHMSEASYLHHIDEGGTNNYIYNAYLIKDRLQELGFPVYYEPYPSDEEIEQYIDWFNQENGLE